MQVSQCDANAARKDKNKKVIGIKRTFKLILGLTIGAGLTAGAKDWQAPDISKLPDDKYGQMVRPERRT